MPVSLSRYSIIWHDNFGPKISDRTLCFCAISDAHGFGKSLDDSQPMSVFCCLPFNVMTGSGVLRHMLNRFSWANTLNVTVYVFFFFLLICVGAMVACTGCSETTGVGCVVLFSTYQTVP